MREFEFTIKYEQGADELMDMFINCPSLHAKTISCYATSEMMWRLDRITGPSDVLEDFDNLLNRLEICNEIIGMGGSAVVDWGHETIYRTEKSRTIYAYRREGDGIRSIPFVLAQHIGDGLLMQAERRGRQYQWRVLIDNQESVSRVCSKLKSGLRDGLKLSVRRISDPHHWTSVGPNIVSLPPEQRVALEAAVKYGYYEKPREHSIKEISEIMDIANSTLQYRLTQAEAKLAKQFVSQAITPEDINKELERSELLEPE